MTAASLMSNNPGADQLLSRSEADETDPSERSDHRHERCLEELSLHHVDHDVDALRVAEFGGRLLHLRLERAVTVAVSTVAEHSVCASGGRKLLLVRDADACDH